VSTVRLNLSRLPDEKKQFAWNWIKQNKPALADLLQDDFFKSAQEAFGGEIEVELKASEINDLKEKFAKGPQAGV
jgi:hypothetical protein